MRESCHQGFPGKSEVPLLQWFYRAMHGFWLLRHLHKCSWSSLGQEVVSKPKFGTIPRPFFGAPSKIMILAGFRYGVAPPLDLWSGHWKLSQPASLASKPPGSSLRFGLGGYRVALTTWVRNKERKARKVFCELSCVCVDVGEAG